MAVTMMLSLSASLVTMDASEFTINNGFINTIVYNYYSSIGSHFEKQADEMY